MSAAKIISNFPSGIVNIPPSKSLSHRAVICAGLAALGGENSRIENLGESEDISATISCMEALGAEYIRENNAVIVSKAKENKYANNLMNCGESGSTLRFMLPITALYSEQFTYTGRGRLMERPLEIYERLFAEKGVRFVRENSTLQVKGPLPAGEYRMAGDVSSQFVSGLLLALPMAEGSSKIVLETPLESAAYVKLTLDVMRDFGVKIDRPDDRTYLISGGQSYKPCNYKVEGDYSQAAFFLAAGALGCDVKCAGMRPESAQGDAAIVDILKQMGARINLQEGILAAEPAELSAIDIDVREIPDLVPPLAVLCALAQGTSHITGAGRLRIKESDRLDAIACELEALGATIMQDEDSLTITGKPLLTGGAADAHNDHRIAMCVAVAAIKCHSQVEFTGWESVGKSYPAFWADFERKLKNG